MDARQDCVQVLAHCTLQASIRGAGLRVHPQATPHLEHGVDEGTQLVGQRHISITAGHHLGGNHPQQRLLSVCRPAQLSRAPWARCTGWASIQQQHTCMNRLSSRRATAPPGTNPLGVLQLGQRLEAEADGIAKARAMVEEVPS